MALRLGASAEMKYPWEAEIEAVEVERAKKFEKKLAVVHRERSQKHVEAINELGLDRWLYFRFVATLRSAFLLVSVLSIPKIVLLLRGSTLQQRDAFALVARVSLGNADTDARLQLGSLVLQLWDAPGFCALDAIQLATLVAAVGWFWARVVVWAIRNPEVKRVSAADYAVCVTGLPPRLTQEDANSRYDFEVVRHFESVLRAVSRIGNPMVCEVALVRSFGRALSAAEEREDVEIRLRRALMLSSTSESRYNFGGLRTAATVPGQVVSRLQSQVEALSHEIAAARMEESQRVVLGAYVIVGTKSERADLLGAYSFSSHFMSPLGKLLQGRSLRLDGRHPLVVTPAPEPGDINWPHFTSASWKRAANQALTILVVAVVLLACVAFSCLILLALVPARITAAAHCVAGGVALYSRDSFNFTESDTASLCTTPFLTGKSSILRCDCFCVPLHQRITDVDSCQSFQSTETTLSMVCCFVLAEISHHILSLAVPKLVKRWKLVLASEETRLSFLLLVIVQSAVPFATSVALLVTKALSREQSGGTSQLLVWEVDLGWYLHAAPVILLWSLSRCFEPLVAAAVRSCRCCSFFSEPELRQPLWRRYASLIPIVIVAAVTQTLLPWQAPLATVALAIRLRSERYMQLASSADTSTRQHSALSITLRFVRTAFLVCVVASCVGAFLGVWVFGISGAQRRGVVGEIFVTVRATTSPSWPLAVLLLCVIIAWTVTTATRTCSWASNCGKAHVLGRPYLPDSSGGVEAAQKKEITTGPVAAVANTAAVRSGSMENFQEAWLVMAHTGILSTYQMSEHPRYRGKSVLQELQSDLARLHTASSNRDSEVMSTLASVGDKAPSRKASQGNSSDG
eukprot:TRINITY_DN41872_c0_g1_i1.p1 TRINITY_DN41872_c0_g1~~TRINITY_DN41872_c0_g1_i1.p1  ORF type:complete len:860 (-),score=110.22 TRINITY_DN41872_c0_g1_i1:55-2634(-)